MAITDEIAAKETLQVQQQQLPQPVNSVAKEFSAYPIQLPNLTRGRLLARFRPVPSQQLLMLVFHAVILIMLDLNANLGMLCVAIASYEDILLECVRKVE